MNQVACMRYPPSTSLCLPPPHFWAPPVTPPSSPDHPLQFTVQTGKKQWLSTSAVLLQLSTCLLTSVPCSGHCGSFCGTWHLGVLAFVVLPVSYLVYQRKSYFALPPSMPLAPTSFLFSVLCSMQHKLAFLFSFPLALHARGSWSHVLAFSPAAGGAGLSFSTLSGWAPKYRGGKHTQIVEDTHFCALKAVRGAALPKQGLPISLSEPCWKWGGVTDPEGWL